MKRVIALLVSCLMMVFIFLRIDFRQFLHYVKEMNVGLLILAVAFFIPQVAITAFRWKELIQHRLHMSLWESTKLILAGNALNILLPSRMGDLSKAYFLKREGKLEIKRGTNIVLFEKYIDLASLGIVILTGILFDFRLNQANLMGLAYSLSMIGIFPVLYFLKLDRWVGHPIFEKNKILSKIKHFLLDSQQYLLELKKNPAHLLFIILTSIFLWFVHILQFYFIFLAFHSTVSLLNVFRLVPLAILVGLVPISMVGIGTRDSAMIYFFSPYEAVPKIVGIGVFATLRYFVPGLLGLPFLNQYIVKEAAEVKPS